jgi:hypothetical protein
MKNTVRILVLVLSAYLVVLIGSCAMRQQDRREAFISKCEAKGGVAFIPKGKGNNPYECRNPDYLISLEE